MMALDFCFDVSDSMSEGVMNPKFKILGTCCHSTKQMSRSWNQFHFRKSSVECKARVVDSTLEQTFIWIPNEGRYLSLSITLPVQKRSLQPWTSNYRDR